MENVLETLEALINESKPDVVFCSASSVNNISDVLNNTTHRPKVKMSTILRNGFRAYSDIVTTEHSFVLPKKSLNNNYPRAIVFSSGTTGVPKGVYLSDDAIKFAAITFK